MPDLSLDGGLLVVSDSRANGKGSAGFVQDRILVGGGSSLHVHHAVGGDLSSVVAAGCLQLSPGATVLLQDVVGGHGFGLENADCPADCANRTFEIAAGASLKASGHLSSGFLSMNTCPLEVVHLSDIHLQSWSSPLLSTPVHQVVVRDVSISYAPPLHDVLVLATTDSFKADSLDVSCKDCAHGVAFNASGNELRALSTPSLVCPLAASVSEGMLQRCTCANHQTTRQAYADRQVVMLQEMMKTCTFCEPHTQFINGTCRKCAPYKAWSDGMSDSCHFLPQDGTQFGALFAASASCIFLAFLFYQILQAPLVIVDAKSQRIPHRLRMEQRSFSMSLQGPIVDLPQFLSRQLNRQLCYRVKGAGLQWLDFSPDNENAVKIQSVDRSKLEVQDAHVPYDCAAAVGALYATNLMRLMLLLCATLFVVVLLPVALQVAIMSGNGVAHVLVTSGYCALPLCLAALILHPAVAWLIEQHCRRTPFAKLLEDYRWRIQFDPNPGPDADNPSNQGLMALTLWELWGHFESFILDRNMHFVVSNIVRPLTRDKQVSFVWTTLCPIPGPQALHTLYARFTVMLGPGKVNVGCLVVIGESDPARSCTLTSPARSENVVLSLGVWCLFEFLLSKQLELELVFATDVGVIGDDGCTSFDIALELGKKIESLQVANCYASSDGDRTRIFDFIVSSLGSLESMDDQIRDLMGQMLEKNLANVGFATSSLLQ
ncbi:pmpB, partial [Symbiodinium sp. CCMP2456]